MKPRILILPISAVAIIALVAWRLSWEPLPRGAISPQAAARRLAPRFELYDQHSQMVKFERYLGRTRLLLLFIGDTPAADHPLVQLLHDRQTEIESTGVQIVVVGLATPYANRQAEQRTGITLAFPVLTDVDLRSPAPAPTHRLWGLAGDDPNDVRQGLYLIDRDGTVRWQGTAPRPATDPARIIDTVAAGEWPSRAAASGADEAARGAATG